MNIQPRLLQGMNFISLVPNCLANHYSEFFKSNHTDKSEIGELQLYLLTIYNRNQTYVKGFNARFKVILNINQDF